MRQFSCLTRWCLLMFILRHCIVVIHFWADLQLHHTRLGQAKEFHAGISCYVHFFGCLFTAVGMTVFFMLNLMMSFSFYCFLCSRNPSSVLCSSLEALVACPSEGLSWSTACKSLHTVVCSVQLVASQKLMDGGSYSPSAHWQCCSPPLAPFSQHCWHQDTCALHLCTQTLGISSILCRVFRALGQVHSSFMVLTSYKQHIQ